MNHFMFIHKCPKCVNKEISDFYVASMVLKKVTGTMSMLRYRHNVTVNSIKTKCTCAECGMVYIHDMTIEEYHSAAFVPESVCPICKKFHCRQWDDIRKLVK